MSIVKSMSQPVHCLFANSWKNGKSNKHSSMIHTTLKPLDSFSLNNGWGAIFPSYCTYITLMFPSEVYTMVSISLNTENKICLMNSLWNHLCSVSCLLTFLCNLCSSVSSNITPVMPSALKLMLDSNHTYGYKYNYSGQLFRVVLLNYDWALETLVLNLFCFDLSIDLWVHLRSSETKPLR